MGIPRTEKVSLWQRLWIWLHCHSIWLLTMLLLLFVVVFSVAAMRKYHLFRVGFDVALIHQAVWNTSQGRFLESHAYDFTNNLLGTDSFFMAAWLAPFYIVFPSLSTLFVVEMIIVAVGAIPLYLLARERLGPAHGLIAALLYLAYLPVQYGSLYEIRFRMMAMAWLCFLLFFVEKERYGALWPFLFLALSCRLDTTIAVAMAGLYAFLRRKRWYYGVTLVVAAVAWYVVMTRLVLPHYSTRAGYMFLEHYLPLGRTPGEIVRTVLADPLLALGVVLEPRKLWYLLQIFLPLLFLPLFHLPAILSALPLFLMNLLSNRKIQTDIYHHYQALLVPFLLLGTIQMWERWGGRALSAADRPDPAAGRPDPAADRPDPQSGTGDSPDAPGPTRSSLLRKVRSWLRGVWHRLGDESRRRLIGTLLLGAALGANWLFYNPLPPLLLDEPPARTEAARVLIGRIPLDAPVAASNLLAPHIPVRRDLFLVPGGDFYYAEHPAERADYVLLDLQSERGAEEVALMNRLLEQPAWQVKAWRDGYILLVRQR